MLVEGCRSFLVLEGWRRDSAAQCTRLRFAGISGIMYPCVIVTSMLSESTA